jgi:hypothetical protein
MAGFHSTVAACHLRCLEILLTPVTVHPNFIPLFPALSPSSLPVSVSSPPNPTPSGRLPPANPTTVAPLPPPHSKTAAKDLQQRSDNTFRDINSSPAKTGDVGDALRPDLQTTPEAYDKVGPGVVYTTYVGAQGGGTGARGVK